MGDYVIRFSNTGVGSMELRLIMNTKRRNNILQVYMYVLYLVSTLTSEREKWQRMRKIECHERRHHGRKRKVFFSSKVEAPGIPQPHASAELLLTYRIVIRAIRNGRFLISIMNAKHITHLDLPSTLLIAKKKERCCNILIMI